MLRKIKIINNLKYKMKQIQHNIIWHYVQGLQGHWKIGRNATPNVVVAQLSATNNSKSIGMALIEKLKCMHAHVSYSVCVCEGERERESCNIHFFDRRK